MRKIFFRKLKANDGYFKSILKNGLYSVDIPIRRNGINTIYNITIKERQNKKKPRITFYIGHYIKGNLIKHIISDQAMALIDDEILNEFNQEINKFIYGENKEL